MRGFEACVFGVMLVVTTSSTWWVAVSGDPAGTPGQGVVGSFQEGCDNVPPPPVAAQTASPLSHSGKRLPALVLTNHTQPQGAGSLLEAAVKMAESGVVVPEAGQRYVEAAVYATSGADAEAWFLLGMLRIASETSVATAAGSLYALQRGCALFPDMCEVLPHHKAELRERFASGSKGDWAHVEQSLKLQASRDQRRPGAAAAVDHRPPRVTIDARSLLPGLHTSPVPNAIGADGNDGNDGACDAGSEGCGDAASAVKGGRPVATLLDNATSHQVQLFATPVFATQVLGRIVAETVVLPSHLEAVAALALSTQRGETSASLAAWQVGLFGAEVSHTQASFNDQVKLEAAARLDTGSGWAALGNMPEFQVLRGAAREAIEDTMQAEGMRVPTAYAWQTLTGVVSVFNGTEAASFGDGDNFDKAMVAIVVLEAQQEWACDLSDPRWWVEQTLRVYLKRGTMLVMPPWVQYTLVPVNGVAAAAGSNADLVTVTFGLQGSWLLSRPPPLAPLGAAASHRPLMVHSRAAATVAEAARAGMAAATPPHPSNSTTDMLTVEPRRHVINTTDLVEQARQLGERGHVVHASLLATQIVRAEPYNSDAWELMGLAGCEQKQLDKCLAAHRMACWLNASLCSFSTEEHDIVAKLMAMDRWQALSHRTELQAAAWLSEASASAGGGRGGGRAEAAAAEAMAAAAAAARVFLFQKPDAKANKASDETMLFASGVVLRTFSTPVVLGSVLALPGVTAAGLQELAALAQSGLAALSSSQAQPNATAANNAFIEWQTNILLDGDGGSDADADADDDGGGGGGDDDTTATDSAFDQRVAMGTGWEALGNHPTFVAVRKAVLEACKGFVNSAGLANPSRAWMSVHAAGSPAQPINYPDSAATFVVHLQTPPGSGLSFEDPRRYERHVTSQDPWPPGEPVFDYNVDVDAIEVGDFALFPSWLRHATLPAAKGEHVVLCFGFGSSWFDAQFSPVYQ
eukprot:m.381717 g.381717  ORF g.381717 m.381717 type:complete len:976 (+) comp20044_c4_seq2:415-3342(+)